MTMQFISRRELNDPLKEMYGASFNSKNKLESERILRDIHSVTQHRSFDKNALCYIVNDGQIKGVGGSTILEDVKTGKLHSNLILNNLGIFLAGVFRGVAGVQSVNINDTAGTVRSFLTYNTDTTYNDQASARIIMQVGSGTTPPARTDFSIETALSTAPESASFASSKPIYNLPNSNYKNNGNVTAGGSGTVNEAVLIAVWEDSGSALRNVALYHDIISPGQVFVIGETIALEYTTQF